MIRNTLFLLIAMTITYASAMDTQKNIELTVFGMKVKKTSALGDVELQRNKEKCVALGLKWSEDVTHVLEILPRYSLKDGTSINCLMRNPHELNQAIINGNKKENKTTLIRILMTPQLPKFIPFDQEARNDIINGSYKSIWFLYGYPITINFVWSENEFLPVVKEGTKSFDRHQKEIKFIRK